MTEAWRARIGTSSRQQLPPLQMKLRGELVNIMPWTLVNLVEFGNLT
jgi:hypothetical protein